MCPQSELSKLLTLLKSPDLSVVSQTTQVRKAQGTIHWVCEPIEIISRHLSERLPKSKEALSVHEVVVQGLQLEAALGMAVHGAACGEQPVVLLGDVL